VLQETSTFICGEPLALVYVLAGLLALFVELWLFNWGITGERLQATLLSLTISYFSVLTLVQIAILVSTGILWTVAKLLPVFSTTERFAPLLVDRPLGLYTWTMLGLIVAMATSSILWQVRRPGVKSLRVPIPKAHDVRTRADTVVETSAKIAHQMQRVIEAHPEGLTLPEIAELLHRDWRGLTVHIKALADAGIVCKEGRRYFPIKGQSYKRHIAP